MQAIVFLTVSFYMVSATLMVIANKWVLNTTEVPIFFVICQLLVAILLFLGAHALRFLQLPIGLDRQVCSGLIPMVSLSVLGLSTSNYTLKYVDASVYQVARGLILPLTVYTSYLFLRVRPSRSILMACSVVTFGFFVGVLLDAVPMSIVGISFGLISSVITALLSVVIKRSLVVVKGSALHLAWYTNLLSSVILIPLVLVMGEFPEVKKLFRPAVGPNAGYEKLWTFLWGSFVTGVLGFFMSIANMLSIKVTSPISHMIASGVRSVTSALLGMWLFGDVLSMSRTTSIAIILCGSIYYTWIKHVESQQAPSTSPKAAYEDIPPDDVEARRGSPKSGALGYRE